MTNLGDMQSTEAPAISLLINLVDYYNELIGLGRLLDETVTIADAQIEAEDIGVADKDRGIREASAVPMAIAERTMDLPARTADGFAAMAKAIAWIDRVRLDMAA